MLEADIQLRLSRLNLDTAFSVAAGEVLALLGPNGSGKSTTLRALVGMLPLAGGRVVLDGTVLEDPAQHIKIPPEKRPIGLMFQDYLLFPHLTALENVAFGLRAQGIDKRPRARRHRRQWRAWIWTAWLRPSRARFPAASNSGWRWPGPWSPIRSCCSSTSPWRRSMSLPRPTSGACSVRPCGGRTRRTCWSLTTLLDAVALGDRMIVIQDGGIVQTGTPAEVTARPRSRYVADLVGVNLLRGTAHGTVLELDGGGRLTCAEPATGPLLAVIAPAAVSVSRQRPEGNEDNTWPGQITAVDLMGDPVRVRTEGTPAITAEVPPAAVDALKLDDGGELWASVDPTAITVYPP
jgi:molybdate transport system ATP-binding protein